MPNIISRAPGPHKADPPFPGRPARLTPAMPARPAPVGLPLNHRTRWETAVNLQDMVVHRDDTTTRMVDRYLMSYEGRVIAVRRHPALLLLPIASTVAALVLCAAVQITIGLVWIWLLWLVSLGYLLWNLAAWSMQFFLVTEHRVMVIRGVLNRDIAMMPMAKVDNIELKRSYTGRALGYGEFIIESAGQKQGLRRVRFVPYPEQLYLEVSSFVFGTVDAAPD
jgi:membrane protein YdbS with pleckstrin-like domain